MIEFNFDYHLFFPCPGPGGHTACWRLLAGIRSFRGMSWPLGDRVAALAGIGLSGFFTRETVGRC